MKKFFILLYAVGLCSCQGNGVMAPVTLKLSPKQEQLTQKSNDFSYSLLKTVYENETNAENVIISPLSASMMLGMLMNGADGQTLAQMKKTFDFSDESMDEVNDYYKTLINALPRLDKSNTIKLANSLWVAENCELLSDFKKTNKESFNATIKNVDFSDKRTAETINRWAFDNTNKMIDQVVTPEDLYKARLVLANALYYKGIWKEKFDKASTSKQHFTTLRNNTIEVDRMHQTDDFGYADLKYAKMLEMNYKEGMYCMDVILPSNESTLSEVIDTLAAGEWGNFVNALHTCEVSVGMPKFKLGYDCELNTPLQKLGMLEVFTTNADLSKVSVESLYLSKVKQTCKLNVDEEGTEAAAVTVGIMPPTAPPPSQRKEFYVDRPFICIIREKQYGTILFMAAVGNVLEQDN